MSGLTSGERAVWAAEFVRALALGRGNIEASLDASGAVLMLRGLRGPRHGRPSIDLVHGGMVDDMLGTGADR